MPDQTTERRYCITHKTHSVDICGEISNLPCDIRALVPVERWEAVQAVIEAATRVRSEHKKARVDAVALGVAFRDLDAGLAALAAADTGGDS